MQTGSSSYELDRSDYDWALTRVEGPGMSRGIIGSTERASDWTKKLTLWGPAVAIAVVMLVIAVFAALRFGFTSPITLGALLLVPIAPIVWVVGAWIMDKWESLGVDGPSARAIKGPVLKKIDQGTAPLPVGRVTMEWDEHALRISDGGKSVEVPWSSRPVVNHEGDRVLVMPFIPKLGAPDVSRMAVIRSDGFDGAPSFEQAIGAWSSYAGA